MMSRKNFINASDSMFFDRNAPRPPVPGEERAHYYSDWGQMEYSSSKNFNSLPRKSYCTQNEYSIPLEQDPKSIACHERLVDSRTPENVSPPACLRWATSLHCLLKDPDGVELFKKYLQVEAGPQAEDALDFWFACEGLRKQNLPERVQQLVKVIYKRFFLKSGLTIPENIKREVGRRVKSPSLGLDPPNELFDEAQAQVETLINKTTYPSFIQSDMYLQYIQSVQNPTGNSGEFSSESSSSSSSISNKDLNSLACGIGPLPTIHEDSELIQNSLMLGHTSGYQAPNMTGPVRLTKDILLATQKNRVMDIRPKTEAYAADMYMFRSTDHHLVSLSSHSDARTESDMSHTDSSADGRSHRNRRQAAIEARQVRENAAMNRETHMHHTLIPRTQRLDKQQCHPLHPTQFAAILIQKLESLKREQDTKDILEKKLKESDSMSLANAIREKLQLEDDNGQHILDDHIAKVFTDCPQHLHSRRRKEKDGFSTFSTDSGNVHDYSDERERFVRGCTGRRSSSKKTLAEFTDSGVSVVSDTPPVEGPVKDPRVLAWLNECERDCRTGSYSHSEISSKHRGYRNSSTTSPNANRHRKGCGSRSSSLERSGASSTLGPAQPFVADPNMPPPPIPNTAAQLEEARRRLMEDDMKTRSRQRLSSKNYLDVTQSSQATLKKSLRGSRQSTADYEDVTTVVFSFCDEQFPYLTKIPGKQITLKQFKEYLPKKGNYRYFFKTACEELDNQVIQEEVSNDSDLLPLWEGRINAQVKLID